MWSPSNQSRLKQNEKTRWASHEQERILQKTASELELGNQLSWVSSLPAFGVKLQQGLSWVSNLLYWLTAKSCEHFLIINLYLPTYLPTHHVGSVSLENPNTTRIQFCLEFTMTILCSNNKQKCHA